MLAEDVWVAARVDAFEIDGCVTHHHQAARDRHDDLAVILVAAARFCSARRLL
jgi:hypothetical protein